MMKKILVAVDTDKSSERVIKTIGELLLSAESKIILAHVILPTESEVAIAVDKPHIHSEEIYRQIEKQLEFYQTLLPYPSDIEIATGNPSEEIIRLAHIHQVDLIVIGTRGLTGLKRILQGSVSSEVVESAPCSVFVVKNK
ncbi:MAG TPA: universal stress protein [Allocoleopsis sp.]